MSFETRQDPPSTEQTPSIDRRSGAVSSERQARFTVPTLDTEVGAEVSAILEERLTGMIDLALTLKHVHWNVVGPNFIAVHEMLDPQYAAAQRMVDDLAERIATLGGVPSGLPGRVSHDRNRPDYTLGRADSLSHLGALDLVYQGCIASHREAMARVAELDPVTEDLLLGQTGELERFHWFVRSHLADWAGGLANRGARDEEAAARAVAVKH